MLLLLFDIDGTLLQRASVEHARALKEAAARVHGLPHLDGHEVEAPGRTDGAIVRDLLLAAGVDGAEADARWAEVQAAAEKAFAEFCPPDLSSRVAPGVADLLPALAARPREFRLSLVSGTLEAVARLTLLRAGLGRWFPPGQGGFGSDHISRAKLPPIARERAGGWARERTVVIGDTPRDIACARADGLRVVAVATGPFELSQLADADAVADSAEAVVAVLEDWA